MLPQGNLSQGLVDVPCPPRVVQLELPQELALPAPALGRTQCEEAALGAPGHLGQCHVGSVAPREL